MKYNAICDLIDENMELKRLLRKEKIDNLKGWISYLEIFIRPTINFRGQYSVSEHIYDLKKELEKYQTLEQ